MIDYSVLAIALAFQAPFICLAVCIYYFCTLGRNGYSRMEHFLAKALAISCLLCMLFEVASGIFTFGFLELPQGVYIWSTLISYTLNLINAILWSEFAISRTHNPSKFMQYAIRGAYFLDFVCLTARIAFKDTELFIYYDSDGVASYGPLDNLQTYGYILIYLLILIMLIRKYRDRTDYAYREVHGKLIFADSILLCACTVYVLFFLPYVIWIGYMLVLLHIYMGNQRSSIYKDELTQLMNRRSLIKDVSEKIKNDDQWSLIMIDVNSFKSINDTYGHNEGDRALEKVASVLVEVAKENDGEAYRQGGDEFVITLNTTEEENIKTICKLIDDRFAECNENDNLPYNLSVSSGYATYDEDTMSTIPDIIELADKRMYEDKVMKKAKNKEE